MYAEGTYCFQNGIDSGVEFGNIRMEWIENHDSHTTPTPKIKQLNDQNTSDKRSMSYNAHHCTVIRYMNFHRGGNKTHTESKTFKTNTI